ncbi:MAG TPA: PEP-CTERM sorting domain-containing protein [Opitutaceae bacterium]|nr:PEP-CTERM sorting domain-containing protein [Opitutaceae bacterium]
MKTKHIISALLATAGLAVGTHAYGTVSAALPDLILGFQQSGNSTNYEADLGSVLNYTSLAPNTLVNLSSSISASDLQSIFGSDTLTSGTVTWAAAATTGAATKTTYVTQFDSIQTSLTPGGTVPASLFFDKSSLNSNSRYQGIQAVTTGLNGQPSLSITETAAIPTSSASSYSHWMGSSTVNGFAAGFDAPTALSLAAGQYSVVDLFQYGIGTTTTPGSYIGSLELSSTGGLFFTNYVPTAIPEPSVYAALLGVATLGFVALRARRRQATV